MMQMDPSIGSLEVRVMVTLSSLGTLINSMNSMTREAQVEAAACRLASPPQSSLRRRFIARTPPASLPFPH